MHLLTRPGGFCQKQALLLSSLPTYALRRALISCSSSAAPSRVSCSPYEGRTLRIGSSSGFAMSNASTHIPNIDVCAAFNYGSVQNEKEDPSELAKREKVSKRLESTAKYFRRLGSLGFWGQLVCTVVSAVILAFSVAISGTPTSQATFYATAGGITAAFLSVFWSFGYIRLSERLRNTIHDLRKAPPRADVVKKLRNGIIINLLGMGLTLLGMQATVGTLVAKALTSTASPYLQGTPAGYSPVLALDVFLVQASANTVLSHFLGLIFSLELLRSVTLSQPPPENVIPKVA